MAARAMWKGRIRFGDVDVPVKLYSAIRSSSGLHFRLLHEKDLQPDKQMMVNPATGDIVDYEDVHRAFPTGDGVLVMLDDEELAALEPEASRDIAITRFVDPVVDPFHFLPRVKQPTLMLNARYDSFYPLET